MSGDDAKSHALNSNHDFYELLDVSEGAGEGEIRSAYRKTALKYHPDKVGAEPEALDKFHLLQIAYDVLSDPTVKELYDNARRARQQKAERDRAYEGRRKWMKEDLERRESGAFKRKREQDDEEERFERELRRLAEDGKRRRKEREDQLRKEAQEVENKEEQFEMDATRSPAPTNRGEVAEIDRSITLRFPQIKSTSNITKEVLISRLERFGKIDEAVLRDKKMKLNGEKHRQPCTIAVVVFKSVVGAHAAVTDFEKVAKMEPEEFGIFESVGWTGGKEPDCIPKNPTPAPPTPVPKPRTNLDIPPPSTPKPAPDGLRKVPSFGSFKGTPKGTPGGVNSPSLDEITMIRLKNAERRRMEEKIRQEEFASETMSSGE